MHGSGQIARRFFLPSQFPNDRLSPTDTPPCIQRLESSGIRTRFPFHRLLPKTEQPTLCVHIQFYDFIIVQRWKKINRKLQKNYKKILTSRKNNAKINEMKMKVCKNKPALGYHGGKGEKQCGAQ